uniref:Ig-like domain-containing protein n=1 Tax=Magallana gigas TaxID=29159 RepID=A0A8W8NVU2_MAGGI
MYFIIFFSDLDDILLYMNGEIKSNIELNENAPLRISCQVDGNPAPTLRLSRSHSDTELRKMQGTWLNYTLNTVQCTDTDTYKCSRSSTGVSNTNKVININVLCNTRFDKAGRFKSTYGSKSGIDTTINVAVPIIANPPPQSSDFKWDGPVQVSARTTISTGDVSYKHVIESFIPMKDHTYFGNYTLSYKGQTVTIITINAEDNLLENSSMESSGEVASISYIIAISLVSILLGLTWFMVAMFVVYDRRYRNIHQKSNYGEESTQLQTQNMTHHYDDLQGTDVDQLEAQNMTQHYDDVQGRVEEGNYTDLKGDNTAAEGDYTELGQCDPETPYEEL